MTKCGEAPVCGFLLYHRITEDLLVLVPVWVSQASVACGHLQFSVVDQIVRLTDQ